MARKRLRKNKHRTMTRRTMGAKRPMSAANKLEAKKKREETTERAKK